MTGEIETGFSFTSLVGIEHSIERNEPQDVFNQARKIIEEQLGEIQTAKKITGGLVSHVYKLKGQRKNGIVKYRGTHFARIPDLVVDPLGIDTEWNALQFLSQIDYATFPQPLALVKDARTILMSDIMPDGETLETRFASRSVTQSDLFQIGEVVGRVHRKMAGVTKVFRDDEEEIYQADLRRRVGISTERSDVSLEKLVEALSHQPKQLIHGDLAPKNIGKGSDGNVTICDVESFYNGNLQFAYGYLSGHILLHTLVDKRTSRQNFMALVKGLQRGDNTFDAEDDLYHKVLLGAILYRLDNKKVPYAVDITHQDKQVISQRARNLVAQNDLGLQNTLTEILRDE